MINKELDRLKVLQKVIEKHLKQKEAATQLNLSVRQIKDSVLDIICSKYSDFGPTLAHEKLTEVHNFTISISSVRNIMLESGVWAPKKPRKSVFSNIDREGPLKESSSKVMVQNMPGLKVEP